MRKKSKGKQYAVSFLMVLFLVLGAVHVQADTDEVQTVSLVLTEDNRYNGEYFKKPEIRYPAVQARQSRSAALTLEEYVVASLEALEPTIDISSYQIPRSEISTYYFQILNNNPNLFYVESTIRYSMNSADMVQSLMVSYIAEPEDIISMREEFEAAADQAVAQAESSMSDVEKALVVHDYLVQDCEYDYENYLNDSLPDSSYTAYGPLVEKTAVCEGYAKAYSYIMEDKLGIPCEMVSSSTMNHAWNMIQIGGKWYHVDATWDDPTWDNIGRVAHKYFLLSDTAISDASHEHEGWTITHTADSTLYDTQFWGNINSAICYFQGDWYYSEYQNTRKTDLVKRSGLLNGTTETVYTANESWNNYINSYMYLSKAYNRIYFNTASVIYKLDGEGSITEAYRPDIPSGNVIFGFTVRGENLCYALQSTPNLNSKQVVSTYAFQAPKIIESVSADPVKVVYDGAAKKITVKGTQAGDVVQYKGEDGSYLQDQPEMVNAGVYTVSYKVERSGYETFYGSAQLEIEQAVPEYTAPSNLQGASGATLETVTLPKGFSWQTDSNTKLKEEGTYTWLVSYTPADIVNYKTVSDIEVKVTVSCPAHQYTSEVTKEPTGTEPGIRTYTCSLCGGSYTENIDALTSQNPEEEATSGQQLQKPEKVSGLTVKKNTVNSLVFSWNQVSGISYRLVLYKGNTIVSTQYTGKNTYTYKNLKAVTTYTLKVTPYIVVDGKNIYADTVGTVKTSTAPAAAKLSKVKKSGSSKAKLTWKKVAGASGYEIYMKTGKAGYKKIKTMKKGTKISYTQTKLKKGKNYTFRLRAYITVGGEKIYGTYSNAKLLKLR